jgi:uncharacterized membrane protein
MTPPRAIPRQRYDWLQGEVTDWAADGILDDAGVEALRHRYTAIEATSARSVLAKVLLWIGGAFLGVGLIWLVAANLEQLSPLVRFVAVAAVWLALLFVPEVLADRGHSRALVGALRLVGAAAFGAVVFQAAQSMQVPAYEPVLVGLWALGAFGHAYVVRGASPLVVALAAGTVWWFWQPLDSSEATLFGWALLVALGGIACVGIAAVHERRMQTFARLWRIVGTGYVLVALFSAALPADSDAHLFGSGAWFVVVTVLAAVAAAAGLALGDRLGRLEVVGAVVAAAAAYGLLLWDVPTTPVGTEQWLHSIASVLVYVLAAVALTALGTLREDRWISGLAMAGLVVFVTFQSFAVLGVVLLGTGYLFDQARRSISASLGQDRPDFLEGA